MNAEKGKNYQNKPTFANEKVKGLTKKEVNRGEKAKICSKPIN